MAADRLAQYVTAFDQALDNALSQCRSCQRFTSPYGGGALLWTNIDDALAMTPMIIGAATKAGVRIAIGLHIGSAAEFQDPEESNIVGSAINIAARVAAIPTVEGGAAATEEFVIAAQSALEDTRRDVFGEKLQVRVKRTEVVYRFLTKKGFQQPNKLPPLAILSIPHKPREMHVLAYDMARFSELSEDKQRDSVDKLTLVIKEALTTMGWELPNTKGIWFTPAGDGGAFILEVRFGAAALHFAQDLRRWAVAFRLELRIGIALGQMVERREGTPIGPAMLEADRTSAKAETGSIAVAESFWQTLRDMDREGLDYSEGDGVTLLKYRDEQVGSDAVKEAKRKYAETLRSQIAMLIGRLGELERLLGQTHREKDQIWKYQDMVTDIQEEIQRKRKLLEEAEQQLRNSTKRQE
ncbi:MAG: hypothetical protein HZA90_18025 [Verrucomicrobia bacterium]|nr:hypothetical protein [Verrucomicrobiota bacterium]